MKRLFNIQLTADENGPADGTVEMKYMPEFPEELAKAIAYKVWEMIENFGQPPEEPLEAAVSPIRKYPFGVVDFTEIVHILAVPGYDDRLALITADGSSRQVPAQGKLREKVMDDFLDFVGGEATLVA